MIAIDPGTDKSAYVMLGRDGKIMNAGIMDNHAMIQFLNPHSDHDLVIEMVASYGMPVGKEVFETCVWIGRFIERAGGKHRKIYRKDVKMHLCSDSRAKDSNIRQALIDKFGPGKDKAIGVKKSPGPLYGFKADMWAALAVAITAAGR